MTNDTLPVDKAKKSPGAKSLTVVNANYWKKVLSNTDFLEIYSRQGMGRKILNKYQGEIFKKGFVSNNDEFTRLREEFNMDAITSTSWKCSSISGYALVYVGYSDVNTVADRATPAPTNGVVDYFYVIPESWVETDIKQNYEDEDKELYKIYTASGSKFPVHESRIIRVRINDEESSFYEPIYNSLQVADNMLWSSGQAMFRAGQGFPVITVNNPQDTIDGAGNPISEISELIDNGILRDINSQTGFISDDRYTFDFKGAEGKALKPTEYWELCLDNISAGSGIPKDILRGVSAGAVTGSEVNERDLSASVRSKQVEEVQPIYEALAARFGLDLTDEDFDWLPTFEENRKEQSETFKLDVEAFDIATRSGLISQSDASNNLSNRHPWLKLEDEPVEINPDKNLDSKHVCSQHNVSDEDVKKSLDVAIKEGSTLPKPIQVTEKKYLRDMAKQYANTGKLIANVFEAFNTDSEDD